MFVKQLGLSRYTLLRVIDVHQEGDDILSGCVMEVTSFALLFCFAPDCLDLNVGDVDGYIE